MSNFELQEKAVQAATRFIERKGFELLETGWTSPEGTTIDLIASDEDSLVFIDVTATEYGEGGFEGGKVKRSDLEIAAASWLAGNCPDGDIQVRFDIIDTPPRVRIETEAVTTGPTGVEMEAVIAAQIAAATIYDMCKAVQRDIIINRVRLLRKEGGKSGLFQAPALD